ncbi:hypothetical protein LSH36_147g08032 [Paralvinella palmiformis]|uniref:DNA-directed RNA polymerase III subunit RPC3 n=1 Tax=Paralvinella palmiformis TaxID=53620 RepID=A0AAD9JV33_9ANNE|nr:hypothetical protein LSH36_147g08032 [Paralvinella palmiformis]
MCLYTSKTLFGDVAELITEELLLHGQLQMSEVINKVHTRLTAALPESSRSPVSAYDIRDQFIKLTQTQFIQRCPGIHNVEEDTPESKALPLFNEQSEEQLYIIPDIDLTGLKRKREGDSSEQAIKKVKVEKGVSDADIYWRVKYDRFDRYLRDQTIIQAVVNKVDRMAGEIMRTILRQSELVSDACATVINPLSYNEIYQALPKELNLTRQLVDQYLKIIVEDSTNFLLKVGDSAGGMYTIDFNKCYTTLCKAHIMSVVQERFGSKSSRIYRLLIVKKQLEQKQIEEFAMVPAKEAKEILYKMLEEQFVRFTEIPKTPDHAPSRTFYLFSVDINQVAHMLLERCCKALYNLMAKRIQELTEHKRLLEKQQRVDAVIASLEQTEADETQRQEIEEMLTPAERSLISKVKNNTKSQLLDDEIFLKYKAISGDEEMLASNIKLKGLMKIQWEKSQLRRTVRSLKGGNPN